MRTKTVWMILVIAAAAWLVAASGGVPRVEFVAAPYVHGNDGAELYAVYCASCHGVAGRGDGPAAPHLKVAVPDLTRLAERQGGFDYWRVARGIGGEDRAGYHVMPSWSTVLEATYSGTARDRLIVHSLVLYLEALQVDSLAPTAVRRTPEIRVAPIEHLTRFDGVTAYGAYCADCHGATGRGDGELALRLPVVVPDLTRIADRRGEFDPQVVRAAIAGRHMVPVPAAEPWFEVWKASYGVGRSTLLLENLTRHVRQMQQPTAWVADEEPDR